MDLIYTNSLRKDIGVISNFYLDLEQSVKKGQNTFEIKLARKTNVLEIGNYIYIEGTEYGGVVDSFKVETAKQTIIHSGRTWRGILEGKIIEPDANAAYLTVSGDANTIIGNLLERTALSDLFEANSVASEISINSYQFDRYTDLYSGLIKMLSKAGAKLHIEYRKQRVVLSAKLIDDYSKQSELTSDMFDFTMKKTSNTVNHLIGLGTGELTERQIVHKYVGANGEIQNEQYFTGLNEISDTYEVNCESFDELNEKTEEALSKKAVSDSLKVTANNLMADLGDKFTACDVELDISVTQYVINKIITIEDGFTKTKYEVGDTL